MKSIFKLAFAAIAMLIVVSACETQTENKTYQGEWLAGNSQEIIAEVENQFAGFSQTMWENSYRYNELYWAGVDSNWDFAQYQMDHILEALEAGFIRRPEIEPSSVQFVNQASPALLQTIIAANNEEFLEQFEAFTASCNSCHAMEEVPFIAITIPQVRFTNVRY